VAIARQSRKTQRHPNDLTKSRKVTDPFAVATTARLVIRPGLLALAEHHQVKTNTKDHFEVGTGMLAKTAAVPTPKDRATMAPTNRSEGGLMAINVSALMPTQRDRMIGGMGMKSLFTVVSEVLEQGEEVHLQIHSPRDQLLELGTRESPFARESATVMTRVTGRLLAHSQKDLRAIAVIMKDRSVAVTKASAAQPQARRPDQRVTATTPVDHFEAVAERTNVAETRIPGHPVKPGLEMTDLFAIAPNEAATVQRRPEEHILRDPEKLLTVTLPHDLGKVARQANLISAALVVPASQSREAKKNRFLSKAP